MIFIGAISLNRPVLPSAVNLTAFASVLHERTFKLNTLSMASACTGSREQVQLGRRACTFPHFDYYRNVETKSAFLMDTQDALAALAALAQESRLAVFRLLVQAGPDGMAASKISEAIDVPPSSLSFHLKELTHADLITSRQEGRFVYYAANFPAMNALLAYLTENCCGGETSCATACTPAPSPGKGARS
jgi:DNA-binding transcriptional ArsR family regulator